MEIIEVEYSELISEGFNNRRVGAKATVAEHESPQAVLWKLKKWVSKELGKESITHYQKVQIAKEIITEMAEKEIPF